MRNDDPEYVTHLESALADAEKEIKWLEVKLNMANEALYAAHREANPTFMGEPLIKSEKDADDIMDHAMYGGTKGERNAD